MEPEKNLKQSISFRDKIIDISTTIGKTVAIDAEMEKLCDLTMRQFKDLFSFKLIHLLFLDENSNTFYFKRTALERDINELNTIKIPAQVEPLSFVFREKKFFVINDSHSFVKNFFPLAIFGPITGEILFIPMIAENQVKGILCLGKETYFNKEEISFIDALTTQIAISMDYAWSIHKVKSFNDMLEQHVRNRTIELINTNNELENTLKELKETQIQLIQQEKMISLGQLAAGIAHEINNPLSFIINNISITQEYLEIFDIQRNGEILQDELKGSFKKEFFLDFESWLEKVKRMKNFSADVEDFKKEFFAPETKDLNKLCNTFLDYILQSLNYYSGLPANLIEKMKGFLIDAQGGLERTKKIVLNLRNFSRLDEAEFQLANLDEGIGNTINIIAHLANEKNIKIFRDLGIKTLLPCYPFKLNQVILNLIVNAIQATPRDGFIEVKSREFEKHVEITVSDNGEGIPEKNISKIFDLYFTTKPVGEGTGMGLYICYKIIDEHKGKIQVKSKVGEGSQFLITLPIEERRTLHGKEQKNSSL